MALRRLQPRSRTAEQRVRRVYRLAGQYRTLERPLLLSLLPFRQPRIDSYPGNADGKRLLHNNDISTGEALDFLEKHRDKPFFLYLAYDAPHEPYIINDTLEYARFEHWDSATKQYAAL